MSFAYNTCDYKYFNDAGVDIITPVDIRLKNGQTLELKTEASFDISDGFFVLILNKSSNFRKGFIIIEGVIDSTYKNKVSLQIMALADIHFMAGTRMAQAILLPVGQFRDRMLTTEFRKIEGGLI